MADTLTPAEKSALEGIGDDAPPPSPSFSILPLPDAVKPIAATAGLTAPPSQPPAPDLLGQRAKPQFSVFGTALPNTDAARQGQTAHPLTVQTMRSFDILDDVDGGRAAKEKAISEATGMDRSVIRDIHPAMLDRLLKRQDVQYNLDRAVHTRRTMASNLEMAAVLKDEIPIMLASERTITRMQTMMREADEAAEPPGTLANIGRGIVRGNRRISGMIAFAGAYIDLYQAKVAGAGLETKDQSALDVLIGDKDREKAPLQLLAKFLSIFGVGTEEDREENLKSALAGLEEAQRHLQLAEKIPLGGRALRFVESAKDRGWGGYLTAIKNDPAGFAEFIASVSAEQATVLAASASAAVLNPAFGAGVMLSSAFSQEAFALERERAKIIKDEFDIDLMTPEGREQFLKSPEAQSRLLEFGLTRGSIITAVEGASFGLLRPISRLQISNLSKYGAMTATQMLAGGAGEAAALKATGQRLDAFEILTEAFAEASPVNVAIEASIATAGDVKNRRDAKRVEAWLKGQTELKGNIAGIPEEKLTSAASVMADQLREDGIESVYLSADELMRFDQDGDLIATLGLDTEAVREAALEGDAVEIGVSTYIRHILGKDGFDALLQHTKFDIEGMTGKQAEEFVASGISEQIEEQLQRRAEQRLAPRVGDADLKKIADDAIKIRDQVSQQLVNTGRYNAQRADMLGQLQAQRFITRAVRMTEETGQPVDALALFEADNLRIEGEQLSDAPSSFVDQALQDTFEKDEDTGEFILREGDAVGRLSVDEQATNFHVNQVRAETEGGGRAAMRALIKQADAQNKTISLFAQPLDDRPVDDLIEFYERLGFQFDGEYGVRNPAGFNQEGVSLLVTPLEATPTGGKNNNIITVKDVAQAMTDDHMEKHGRQFFPEDSQEDFDAVLDMARLEVANQLSRGNSGVGWYAKDVQDAIDLTAQLFPTLVTEPGHKDYFLFMAGLFSNGTNPTQAWEMAAGAYELFLESGFIPTERRRADGSAVAMTTFKDKSGKKVTRPAGWGARNTPNVQQLTAFKYVAEREGGLQEAVNWFLSEHPREEINQVMTESGAYKAGRYKTKAEKEGPPVRGTEILGPKLGNYTSSLLGIEVTEDDTTVDLWYIRSVRRWGGRLLEPPIHAASGIVGQPSPNNNGAERKAINRITGILAEENNLGPEDIQAVLWFFEKRLWATHGLRLDEGTNSNGAKTLLEKRGINVSEGSDQQGIGDTQDFALNQTPEGIARLFSKAAQVVKDAKQDKATGEQWLGMLKNAGVKESEIEWTVGLREWLELASRDGVKLSKSDILAFIEQNGIRLSETYLGISQSSKLEAKINEQKFQVFKIERNLDLVEERRDEAQRADDQEFAENFQKELNALSDQLEEALAAQRALEIQREDVFDRPVRFSQYSREGGENDREIYITIPIFDGTGLSDQRVEQLEAARSLLFDKEFSDAPMSDEDWKQVGEIDALLEKHRRENALLGNATIDDWLVPGAHQIDDPVADNRLVVRIRAADYVGADGKKKLVIQEIQGDRQLAIAEDKKRGEASLIPPIPFITSPAYVELALKRMLVVAVEEGYDSISWTAGETQAERYDLSKEVQGIEVIPIGNNEVAIRAQLKGRSEYETLATEVPEDEISGYIGKELAEKVAGQLGDNSQDNRLEIRANLALAREVDAFQERFRQPGVLLPDAYIDRMKEISRRLERPKTVVLEGLDLKIGGEGLKKLYDNVTPNVANKLGKKFGAKVFVEKVVVENVDRMDEESGDFRELNIDEARRILGAGFEISAIDPEGDGVTVYPYDARAVELGFNTDRDLENLIGYHIDAAQESIMPDYLVAEITGKEKVQDEVWTLPVTEELRDQVLSEGLPMFQRKDDDPRGGFIPSDLMPDQDGRQVNLIQIFEKADASTFLHESGHFWLEQLKTDADRVGGQFQKDFDLVTKWWKGRSLEIRDEAIRRAKKRGDKVSVSVLQSMSDAQVKSYVSRGDLRGEEGRAARWLSVAMHEQFARGVESYFATGNAPSLGLADLFAQFAAWIQSVYRRFTGTDVQMSDEVRGVMDRLLATDEEIAVAQGQYELASLFETAEEAGMTPKQFAALQRKIQQGVTASKAQQMAKKMAEEQRARTKWWNEERETLREQATDEVKQQDAYRLLWVLSTGGMADGSQAATHERLGQIDRKLLAPYLEARGLTFKDLPKAGRASITATGKDLVDPGTAAAAFGFADADAMVDALVALPPFEAAVEADIDRRMAQEHGSMDLQGQEEAVASVHGDHVAKGLAAELEALRTTEPAFKLQFVRAYARNKLNRMPVGDVKAFKFLTAEKRSARMARAALKKGDKAEAYRHQFQRLVNHYLAREAIKAERTLQKQRRALKDYQNPKKKFPGVDAKYVDKIKEIVAVIDFEAPVSDRRRALAELQAIQEFILEAQEVDGAVIELPQWLQDKDALENMRDMTYGRFVETYEMMRALEKQGRLAKKLRLGKELRDRQEVISEMRAKLAGRDTSRVNKLRSTFISPGGGVEFQPALHSTLAALTEVDGSLLKIEMLLEAIDGEPLGPWQHTIYQPFADSYNRSLEMMADVSKMIEERMAAMPKNVRKNLGKRVDVGDFGPPDSKWRRENLLMLALNVGNESNLEKLVEGYKEQGWNISEDLVSDVLDQLTKEEWDFVQSIWDYADKLWPSVEAIFRAENGVSPPRVEARTVTTLHGDYRGGYFPMLYDYSYASGAAAARNEQRNALEVMQSGAGRASVNSSMTKGRTGYSAPVSLDINRLTEGFNTAIHYITHYDAVRNVRKVMGDEELRSDLERTVGKAYAREIDNWVAALAANNGDATPLTRIEKTVAAITRNTTVAALGFSYTTLAAQTFGLTTAYDRLLQDAGYGPVNAGKMAKFLASGLKQVFNPAKRQAAFAASAELRHRFENVDRELRSTILKLKGKDGKFNKALEFSMTSIAAMQVYTVDVPTWIAAYNYALSVDPSDDARAVNYADRVVRMSQSSGAPKDLSTIQRRQGLVRLGTMFYTYFSALYGILRGVGVEFSDNVRRDPVRASMKAATRVFIVVTLQEMASAFIRGKLPDWEPEDEDEEGMAKFLLKATLTGATATIPFARDIVSGIYSDYGYSGSPVAMFGENVRKAAGEVDDLLDEDEAEAVKAADFLKPFIVVAGVLTGKIPSIQTNRFLDGLQALWDEEDEWSYEDLLRGYDPDIAAKRD